MLQCYETCCNTSQLNFIPCNICVLQIIFITVLLQVITQWYYVILHVTAFVRTHKTTCCNTFHYHSLLIKHLITVVFHLRINILRCWCSSVNDDNLPTKDVQCKIIFYTLENYLNNLPYVFALASLCSGYVIGFDDVVDVVKRRCSTCININIKNPHTPSAQT